MNTMIYQMQKEKKWSTNINLKNYFLNHIDLWLENGESTEKGDLTDKEDLTDGKESVDLSDKPLLEGDEEEVKEGKGLQILTSNKLLTSLTILLAQIKAINNS